MTESIKVHHVEITFPFIPRGVSVCACYISRQLGEGVYVTDLDCTKCTGLRLSIVLTS